MFKKYLAVVFVSLFCFNYMHSQASMGVVLHEEESLDGYTFFSPFSGTKAYLIDNCGHLVNEWDRGTRPGLAAYFLENGLMLRTYKPSPAGPFNSASNSGGLELVDWDNNTVWHYEWNTSETISHHDAVYMPNGNILMLTWELVYEDELVELGRDPDEIAIEGFMWSERIVEIEPVGSDEINVVWEWRMKDHYIQDFDATKLNYGVIAEHPELFNINLPELNSNNSHSSRDWNHFNSIDYNEDLDQILISTRNSDEIWILDHSTTSQEAASHEGGIYGKGGDILYRWGNASAYDRAAVSAQRLFGQHGVHWIREGLPDAGKIMIFNNGNGRPGPDYSTAEILSPPQDSLGGYNIEEEAPFGPEAPEILYGNWPGEDFYSAYLSNAQRLLNGNTILMSGSNGIIFEIDENRDKVWEYVIPLYGDTPGSQGGNISNNWSFRGYKYPPDYPGFEGIDLSPGDFIEQGGNPTECELTTSISETINTNLNIKVLYNPNSRQLDIYNPKLLNLNLSLFDISGIEIPIQQRVQDLHFTTQINLNKGLFILNIRTDNNEYLNHKIVQY